MEILDLSHNSIKSCGQFLQVYSNFLVELRILTFNLIYCLKKNLPKLKKLNLSFNKLESMPDVSHSANTSQLEHLDLSYNNIETIETECNYIRESPPPLQIYSKKVKIKG